MLISIDDEGNTRIKATNNRKYLCLYMVEGEECEPVFESAAEIFDKMDLDDCYSISVNLYTITGTGFNRKPEHCLFYGTWHNPEDRLRMEIRTEDGTVLDFGYGSDH